ncbi:TPA: AAA family ATPase [Elizabethkingia anophelis]|nr:AAA family ATPase [Elizabethkingia anophelis]HBN6704705.1 AAA family ATPase [Elizabethkingia anophelis]HBN6708736.1 AAA family ATPase [Elizabethkingia anophelis]HBN6715662.1 AAA family ATPase [Elizabethkingia anophelis]HBN6717060.1 AAA family ATPase [Elizabethkingia anophelis]
MEFLYIYIKQYKGISNIGINLSNEFKFRFDEDKNELIISSAEHYIPEFFGENITNLTAIIGENGAGKTTVLRYIVEYLSAGIHNHNDDNSIIVFRKGNQISYFSTKDISIISQDGISKPKIVFDTEDIRSSAVTVFLSNVFDPTSYYTHDYLHGQLGETKNLSTQYLLYNDYQNRTGQDALRKNLTYEQRFSAFAAEEMIRMVRLLRWIGQKEEKGVPFPVNLPSHLNISLVFNESEEYQSILKEIRKASENYFNIRRSGRNRFLINAFIASIAYILNEIKFIVGSEIVTQKYQNVPKRVLDYLYRNKYRINDYSIVPEIHDIFYSILREDEYGILNKTISSIQAFLEGLDKFVHGKNIYVSKDNNSISVGLTKVNKGNLETLIDEYYDTKGISSYVDFFFSHSPGTNSSLSSGEYALLLVFSRLNSIKVDSKKPLIILIDEAELALHPQWQKQFISHFVDFIETRFKNHKVQIILTAHSPFILSDLPSNCIVLLKKENGKTITFDSLQSTKETFGANIHELFTDAFFLQDGLMGEFSRKKISDLINEINQQKQISIEDFDTKYKNRIEIIGEQFLKAKILELVAEKSDIQLIDKIIDRRNNEIEILRQIRNRKKDD